MPKKSIYRRNVVPHSWEVQTAKARFNELFRLARSEGPQLITQEGKDGVVLLTVEQFEELNGQFTHPASLVQFLRKSPVGFEFGLEPGNDTGVDFPF